MVSMKKITRVIICLIVLPLVGFVILWILYRVSKVLMPITATMPQYERLLRWSVCIAIEKISGLLLCGVLAFTSFRLQAGTQASKWAFAILTALLLQAILVLRWTMYWGVGSYLMHNRPFFTLWATGGFAFIGGGIAKIIEKRKMRTQATQAYGGSSKAKPPPLN